MENMGHKLGTTFTIHGQSDNRVPVAGPGGGAKLTSNSRMLADPI